MEKKKPLILISNDDGYQSGGIRQLVSFLSDMGEIVVCAPDGARSGYSRAFSAQPPLYLNRQEDMYGAQVWSCTGTPVDCVKIAIARLLGGRMPDVVIGGINHGDNSTVNNHYSGTMGVAIEGCLKYLPAIAFSSCDYNPDADLSNLRPYIRKITGHVLAHGLPKGVCLNVNFPQTDSFAGIRVCRMGYGSWIHEVAECRHPRGNRYYWMVGEYRDDEPEATDNDRWALAHDYVSITPTTIDVTAYEAMEEMRALEG